MNINIEKIKKFKVAWDLEKPVKSWVSGQIASSQNRHHRIKANGKCPLFDMYDSVWTKNKNQGNFFLYKWSILIQLIA